MIRLYINNREVELSSETQFAITKQFEDITNPTTIINDWSKTVEIPFTASNNLLFGNLYNPDRITSGAVGIGVSFDPLQKFDFRLDYNDAVLMQGYGKMNSISQNKGKGKYNITLFGELGKVFSEMKKITFDENTDEVNYLIDGSQYVDTYLTRDTVYDSWVSNGQSSDSLTGDFTNYIGFAPNNSFDSVFDYKTWQNGDSESDTFTHTLETINFADSTGIEPDTAIGDGLLPREIGEYRSYLQLPFIYFNKLFKIFQTKAESVTGYTFELDADWFKTTNPYWYDLVFLLNRLDIDNGANLLNYYDDLLIDTSNNTRRYFATWGMSNFDDLISYRLFTKNVISEQKQILVNTVSPKVNRFLITSPTVLNYKLNTYFVLPATGGSIDTNNGLLFTITITGENGESEDLNYLIVNKNSTLTYSGATIVKTESTASGSSQITVPTIDASFILTDNKFGEYVETSYSVRWLYDTYPYDTPGVTGTSYFYTDYSGVDQSSVSAKINDEYWARSNAKLTLNRIWNKEVNVFEQILNYCKMYRIGVFVDDKEKKIRFTPLKKYFSTYTVVDWTDKIDKNKDFTVQPITFENKYVLFNYDEYDSFLNKQYLEKYGINYGEYRLISDYNFNTDTTNLFEGIKLSINKTDNVLSWTNLFDNKRVVYSFGEELFIDCKDKDGKYVDTFGQYYFYKGKKQFDTNLQLRSVVITDDTPFQQYSDKYFYSQDYYNKGVTTYPYLSIVKDGKLCVFNKPKENYTYLNTEYDTATSIYDNIWSAYLAERYNRNNKIVTCYLRLKPTDYQNFEFNQFIKIENQLYFVNKIYDYDINSSESTKVDLITIQDPSGYTN